DIPINTRQQLVIQAGPRLGTPEPVNIAAAQPAIFTNGSGSEGMIFRIRDGVADPVTVANPASEGDTILIHSSGLGGVTGTVQAGQAPPAPAPATVNPVSVSLGGISVPADFAGLSPDTPGVYHVRAAVPAGVQKGDAVPVVLTTAGQTSPAVTMAIR
ncbi:MAG TPA: hypothetical protein VFL57_20420, partial [Bryobacteraceae bacterium]|nr:hypothetical protein [Bryobacteraceae bacterium]